MLIQKRTGMTGAELYAILSNDRAGQGSADPETQATYNGIAGVQIKMYRADFPHSKADDDEVIMRSLTGHCTCGGDEHPQHRGVYHVGTKRNLVTYVARM